MMMMVMVHSISAKVIVTIIAWIIVVISMIVLIATVVTVVMMTVMTVHCLKKLLLSVSSRDLILILEKCLKKSFCFYRQKSASFYACFFFGTVRVILKCLSRMKLVIAKQE